MSKEQKRTIVAKKEMIAALRANLGVVTPALKAANVSRTAYYEWLKEDEQFRNDVEHCGEETLDFAENALLKQIKGGNPTSTIFYLKTKGKKRGYVERVENDLMTGGKSLTLADAFMRIEEQSKE